MNSKQAKKQRRIAKQMAVNKPPSEVDKTYKRLKSTYKTVKGQI